LKVDHHPKIRSDDTIGANGRFVDNQENSIPVIPCQSEDFIFREALVELECDSVDCFASMFLGYGEELLLEAAWRRRN